MAARSLETNAIRIPMNDPKAPPSFDSTWERDIYAEGRHLNRYPFDSVVSFVFRHAPRDRARAEVRILEVGCGAANNLWFAAREGFSVAGLDGSPAAIESARARFTAEGLAGDLRVGDFTQLPFEHDSFDLVIDRGALTCTGLLAARRAIGELHRVTRRGARFHFNPYSARHTSAASGRAVGDGLVVDVAAGSLVGVGQLCFYDRAQVDAALDGYFRAQSVDHLELTDGKSVHAEWRVVAERIDS